MSENIPPELQEKILEKLPVDDLLRFTSVCKTWYDLITSSSFISSHHKNQEPKLLIAHETTTYMSIFSLHHDNQTFDRISNLNPPQEIPIYSLEVIGNFRGLYCLYLSHDYIDIILLWNPTIRKYRSTTMKPTDSTKRSYIGFCYLSEIDDYKIVRIIHRIEQGVDVVPPDVEVYELKIDTWRSLDVPDFPYVHDLIAKQAVLNGIVHWIVFRPNCVDFTSEARIGTFDMKSETFSTIMCPDERDCGANIEVFTFRESICVAQGLDSGLRIWMMKEYGVVDSWENQFNIVTRPYPSPISICSRKNGDILILNDSVDRCVCSMTSFDPETNQVMNFEVRQSGIFLVDSYVESLVLIKSSNRILKRRCEDDDQAKVNKNVRIG